MVRQRGHSRVAAAMSLAAALLIGGPRCGLATTGGADQDIPFDYLVIDETAEGHRAVADVDGDGRGDIAAVHFVSGDDKVVWYGFPDWTLHPVVWVSTYADFQNYRSDDLELGDLDNDGDEDMVGRVGPPTDGDGLVVWWENPRPGGDPATETWVRHDIGHTNYIKDLGVADLNRDGKLDVVARETDRTFIFVQDSPAVWTLARVIDHHSHEGMALGDLDGDGDEDVVLNGFWLENPHPAALSDVWPEHDIDSRWWSQTGHGWQDNNSNVAVADVDGDRKLDVLLSQSELPGYPVSWYEADDPRAGPWTEHTIEAVFDYCQTLQAGDVDLDGDTDVLAAMFPRWPAPGYPVVIYRNEGGGAAWTSQELADTGIYHGVLGDLGSDGDLDVVGLRNYDSPPIEIWENKLRESCILGLDTWSTIQLDDSRAKWGDWDTPSWAKYFGLAMGDLTGDGFADMVSGRYFYRNPGGDMTDPWTRVDLGLNCDANLLLDVDSDGRGDVIASAGDRVLWLEADDAAGDAWTATVIDDAFPKPGHGNPQGYAVAQIVTGGRPEVLLHENGVYGYQVPADPTAGPWPRTKLVDDSNGEGIGLGDLDGDDDIDIAVGHHPPGWQEGDPRYIKWCPNPGDGSGGWSEVLIGTIDGNFPDRVAVADLNGDDRPDIVVTEEEQPVQPLWKTYWFEAPADPLQTDWVRHTLVTQHTTNSLDVADVDRDGDLDIVLGEHRGTEKLAVWENDGAGNFSERLVDTGKESHLGARVADLDADGDLEIVSIAWDDYQYLHLWRNDNTCVGGSANRPPLVEAGQDQTIFLPSLAVMLDGEVTDDGLPATGTLTTLWSRQSGPGSVSFADPAQTDTVATFSEGGSYLLRLSANDGELEAWDEVRVAVVPRGSDMVLHWPFDEGSGGTAHDLTAWGNDGTLLDAAWSSGPLDGALELNGSTSYVSRASAALNGPFPATPAQAGGFTLTAWIRLASLGHRNPIAGKQGNEQRGFMFMTEDDDRLALELFKNQSDGSLVSTTRALAADTDTHVAASYELVTDGTSRVRLYVDGSEEAGSDSVVGPLATNATAFEAGRYWWSSAWSGYFHGRLDDVRVYSRALSACEIGRVMSGWGDHDQDGMPDAWEASHLGGTAEPAEGDRDADGATNLEEYLAGTDPDDRSSRLVLWLAKDGAETRLSFDSIVAAAPDYACEDRSYTLAEAGEPSSPAWLPVGACEALPASGGRQTCVFTPDPAAAFYQLDPALSTR